MPFKIGADRIDVPDGTYQGSLLKVEEGSSEFGEYRKWFFLVNVDGSGVELSCATSANTGPKTRSYAFLKALLRRDLKAGEQLDDPIGQQCLVVVSHNKNGFATVSDVLPYKQPEAVVAGIPR